MFAKSIYKKMKKIIYIFALVAFTLTSCDKNEISNEITNNLSTEDLKLAAAMQNVAKEICLITNDNYAVNEVFSMVNASINYGLDEHVHFEDLFFVGDSKLISKPQRTKISKAISNSITTKELNSDVSLLLENGTRLYWPYSEYWDGKAQPVIAYAAVDSKDDKITAYKLINVNGKLVIDSLVVDEDYAMNNPVWVITKSETSYDELPNFVKGETIKNNIVYAQPSNFMNKVEQQDLPLNDPNFVYDMQIGKVQCLEQYDSWFFGGGSEIRFRMVGAKMIGNQITADFQTQIVSCDFTRSQIRDKVIKDYNQILNLDFTPLETFNGFIVWEDDKAKKTQPVNFEVGIKDIGTIKASFNIGKDDPILHQISLERSAFFTTYKIDRGNGFWGEFPILRSGEVKYTLETRIYRRAY